MNIRTKIMLSVMAGATITALTVGTIIAFDIKSIIAVTAIVSASSAAVALIGLFVANDIAQPLNTAVDILCEMNRGHIGTKLNLTRNDEIGVMGAALDALADNLRTTDTVPMRALAADDVIPSAYGETQTVAAQYGRRNQPTTAQKKWYAAIPNKNAYVATMLAFKTPGQAMSNDDVFTLDDCEMWR